MCCLYTVMRRITMQKMPTPMPMPLLMLLLPFFLLPLTGCEKLDELRQRSGDATDKTVRTTVPPEMQADANSSFPSISADGRYIAFRSDATNLVSGTTNGAAGIYVKDRQTGSTIRVSVNNDGSQSSRDAVNPVISANGRMIAFESSADNLVPGTAANKCTPISGTSSNCQDVFVRDLDSGTTSLVSAGSGGVRGNQDSGSPVISTDGRFVAFRSAASDLDPEDTNEKADIFLKDTRLGTIQRVSVSASGKYGNDESSRPAISADGRVVAFRSAADNLVPGDTNGKPDVFVKEMQSGTITLVSAGAVGGPANGGSGDSVVEISGDGRWVVFESEASNLVPDDTNGKRDIFLKDIQTGAVTRVSTSTDGEEGSQDSYKSAGVSADGLRVAFQSDAPDLVAGEMGNKSNIFIRDLKTGNVELVSTSSSGAAGNGDSDAVSVSADGLWVAFESAAANLISDDTNKKKDIFLRDVKTGAITRVSTSTADVL